MYSTLDIRINPQLTLRIFQAGIGAPMVFVHGWLLGGEIFTPLFPALVAQGYRCISVDLRGFGDSVTTLTIFNYDTFADDLALLFEHLNLSQITLAGFSMGAAIVLRYAANHGLARIKKMILMAPAAPRFTNGDNFNAGIHMKTCAALLRQYQMNPLFAINTFLNNITYTNAAQKKMWLQTIALKTQPQAAIQSLKALQETDLRSVLPSVTCPVTILQGEQDIINPPTLAEYLCQHLPMATLQQLPNCGHALFLEAAAGGALFF